MPLRNFVVIAIMTAFSLACYGVAAKSRYANLFAEVLDVVDKEALHDIPRESLFDSAINGMLSDLDQHSQYISNERFQAFDEDMRQEFGGVGMYVDVDQESQILQVTAAMPNTPAFRGGLLPGDKILEIEGKSTQGMTRGDAIALMRGKPGSSVNLKLETKDGERSVDLNREFIPVDSVHGDSHNLDGSWDFFLQENPRIGYIRLLQFGEKTTVEVREALKEINGKVDGLIIDLRNNSGGLLDSAVDICDMFLDEQKLIVQTKGRGETVLDEHFSTSTVEYSASKPLVVLINRESASASEIVAACLRDYDRAIIIGESSWGKGTVQNVIPIRQGKSALKLTTASYWPPSGKNFDRSQQLNETPGKHGVHPHEGFEVILTEQEVIENYRQRQSRDLHRLIQQSLGIEETPMEYQDKPLRKAIEYFRSILKDKNIAA